MFSTVNVLWHRGLPTIKSYSIIDIIFFQSFNHTKHGLDLSAPPFHCPLCLEMRAGNEEAGRQSSDNSFTSSQISDKSYNSQFSEKKKETLQISDNIEKETALTV